MADPEQTTDLGLRGPNQPEHELVGVNLFGMKGLWKQVAPDTFEMEFGRFDPETNQEDTINPYKVILFGTQHADSAAKFGISRTQFVIRAIKSLEGVDYYIVDPGSRNVTRVIGFNAALTDDSKLYYNQPFPLMDGDVIEIGPRDGFQFRADINDGILVLTPIRETFRLFAYPDILEG